MYEIILSWNKHKSKFCLEIDCVAGTPANASDTESKELSLNVKNVYFGLV